MRAAAATVCRPTPSFRCFLPKVVYVLTKRPEDLQKLIDEQVNKHTHTHKTPRPKTPFR